MREMKFLRFSSTLHILLKWFLQNYKLTRIFNWIAYMGMAALKCWVLPHHPLFPSLPSDFAQSISFIYSSSYYLILHIFFGEFQSLSLYLEHNRCLINTKFNERKGIHEHMNEWRRNEWNWIREDLECQARVIGIHCAVVGREMQLQGVRCMDLTHMLKSKIRKRKHAQKKEMEWETQQQKSENLFVIKMSHLCI